MSITTHQASLRTPEPKVPGMRKEVRGGNWRFAPGFECCHPGLLLYSCLSDFVLGMPCLTSLGSRMWGYLGHIVSTLCTGWVWAQSVPRAHGLGCAQSHPGAHSAWVLLEPRPQCTGPRSWLVLLQALPPGHADGCHIS